MKGATAMQNGIQQSSETIKSPVLPTPTDDNNPTAAHPWVLLFGALFIGFISEAFLHGQPPGFGYALATVSTVAIWLAMGRAQDAWPSPAGWILMCVIIFVGLMVGVRASPVLVALNIMTGIGLALLMAAVYVPGKLTHFSLTDYAIALCISGLSTLIQPFILLFGDLRKDWPALGRHRGLASVLMGILLALPLLVIFSLLFASADVVFAAFMRRLFDWIDLTKMIVRLIPSLLLSWLALGLLRHAFIRSGCSGNSHVLNNLDFPRIGGITAITALALVSALFIGFVAVQAVYLFGGADTLARTGMSYSDYTRRGFFELVMVATLILSLTLLSDWLVREITGSARRIINLLHTLLITLTLIILASALLRMHLYTQEYGLTELRFYTTAFMAWLAVILVWLVVIVIAGFAFTGSENEAKGYKSRRSFAFGTLVTSLVVIIVLDMINPDALIVRTNLKRAVAGVGQPLDIKYITQTLSTDAVPELLVRAKVLPNPEDRDSLARHLRKKNQDLNRQRATLNWRGLNWSTMNARRLLAVNHPIDAKSGL